MEHLALLSLGLLQEHVYLTFALHSWSKHVNSAGIDRRLHIEPGGEVGHILAPVADGEGVGAGIQGDVCDGVGPVTVVLDVNLGLGAAVRDDLDGQVRWAGVGAVHDELTLLPDLGPLKTGTGAADLRTQTEELPTNLPRDEISGALRKYVHESNKIKAFQWSHCDFKGT